MASFARHGIQVCLHTFNDDLVVPMGVKRVDASVLADLTEVLSYTQGGHRQSVAAFTDIYRYRVLAQQPGWWFDTDVFCLKDASWYEPLERQSKGLLAGFQDESKLNGAVLYISDTKVAQELEHMATAKGYSFDWGAIGPDLMTQFAVMNPTRVTLVGRELFYPVHYLEAERLFLPEARETCARSAENAVCIHVWNEFLRRWRVPKNVPPCAGSFLHALFMQVELDASTNNLPLDTFMALRSYGEIGRVGHSALRSIAALKRVRERFSRRSRGPVVCYEPQGAPRASSR
ncbi:MAG TPA: hypothetical protein VL598_09630 [Trinickia sp.]|uniref:hypothetical protein n=1 Tax=Trinickia sp. TaxID=2571163 RepID=UPI002BE0A065|nr:hypothetical protein [Trinickia sp.]HTI17912.1 hypothetical protein [Trinickia sp.]